MDNRFQDFFEASQYTALKNHLYNYQLRKRAVEASLQNEPLSLILEVGSGISPVMTTSDRIVYSELSLTALQTLRQERVKGWYVAADATRLPFKEHAFSHAIASEVLEHLPEDQEAFQELSRVVKPGGKLVVTFPHRKFYFSIDDTFVKHFRRYELSEMEERLKEVGFETINIQKVLGPLDKVAMVFAVLIYSNLQKLASWCTAAGSKPPVEKSKISGNWLLATSHFLFKWLNRLYGALAWLDAKIVPRALATILLVKAIKTGSDPDQLNRV
jgi:SAM-dependent methyltransferase